MHESGPSGSGEFGGNDFTQQAADFELWEAELRDNEQIAYLSNEIGRLSLDQTVEVSSDRDEHKTDDEIIEQYIKPKDETEKSFETMPDNQNIHSTGESFLTGNEMFGAAMGLIYFTTGVPADDILDQR